MVTRRRPATAATAALVAPVTARPFPSGRDLLGPPPLTGLDDRAAYDALERALADEIQPRNTIEWLRLRDVVHLIWAAQRLRRVRASVLALARPDAVARLLRTGAATRACFDDDQELRTAAALYLARDEEVVAEVRAALQRLGLEESAIDDAALQIALDDIERLDRLILQADQRRDAVLRDLERSRDARDRAVAEASEVIDAEFEG